MIWLRAKYWLMVFLSTGLLLQAGCPTGKDFQTATSAAMQKFANDLIGLVVKNWSNSLVGL